MKWWLRFSEKCQVYIGPWWDCKSWHEMCSTAVAACNVYGLMGWQPWTSTWHLYERWHPIKKQVFKYKYGVWGHSNQVVGTENPAKLSSSPRHPQSHVYNNLMLPQFWVSVYSSSNCESSCNALIIWDIGVYGLLKLDVLGHEAQI